MEVKRVGAIKTFTIAKVLVIGKVHMTREGEEMFASFEGCEKVLTIGHIDPRPHRERSPNTTEYALP